MVLRILSPELELLVKFQIQDSNSAPAEGRLHLWFLIIGGLQTHRSAKPQLGKIRQDTEIGWFPIIQNQRLKKLLTPI